MMNKSEVIRAPCVNSPPSEHWCWLEEDKRQRLKVLFDDWFGRLPGATQTFNREALESLSRTLVKQSCGIIMNEPVCAAQVCLYLMRSRDGSLDKRLTEMFHWMELECAVLASHVMLYQLHRNLPSDNVLGESDQTLHIRGMARTSGELVNNILQTLSKHSLQMLIREEL